jgi:hypothetical protein
MVGNDEALKPECHVGMEFSKEYVAILSQVKFFLSEISDIS